MVITKIRCWKTPSGEYIRQGEISCAGLFRSDFNFLKKFSLINKIVCIYGLIRIKR
jgi:hypothetical protein